MAIHCEACGGRDVTEAHANRCKRLHEERGAAVAHGASAQIPDVTTSDLWAHLGHVGSFEDATRIVRQVVDLGWRPVVGSDPRRLWRSTPTTDDAPLWEDA